MISKELNFPIIYRNNEVIGYGGNQEWFQDSWQQKAGCGSISGTNLAAYYAANSEQAAEMYQGDVSRFDYAEFLYAMTQMYQYMKPGIFGFPSVTKFAEQFRKYCRHRNVSVEEVILDKYESVREANCFVKEHIDAGRPIALIILTHRAQELIEYTWHWVTVTGYTEDEENNAGLEIVISNYGKRETLPGNVLFELHPKNKIRMASFKLQ